MRVSYTLRSAFEQDKPAQLLAVRSLLEETAFEFEDREAIGAALHLFEQGSCGFVDCLVVAKHARQGCDFTASFDRGMRKLPGVKQRPWMPTPNVDGQARATANLRTNAK